MNNFLLMNSKDIVKVGDDWKMYYPHALYCLINVDDQLNIYSAFKIKGWMFLMKKAVVNIEMVIINEIVSDDEFSNNVKGFCKVKKEFSDPFTLLAFLHSVYRLEYINDILKCSGKNFDDFENCNFESIGYCFFKLVIEDMKGDRIYKYKNSFNSEKKFISNMTLIQDLKGIIFPLYEYKFENQPNNQYGNHFLSINTSKNKWKVSNSPIMNCINGVFMENTCSYAFIDDSDLSFIYNNIYSIFADMLIYNKSIYDTSVEPIEYITDTDTNFSSTRLIQFMPINPRDCIEFIAYLPYIATIIQTEKEIWDNGKCVGIYGSNIYVEVYIAQDVSDDYSVNIKCKNDDYITLHDIINKVQEVKYGKTD